MKQIKIFLLLIFFSFTNINVCFEHPQRLNLNYNSQYNDRYTLRESTSKIDPLEVVANSTFGLSAIYTLCKLIKCLLTGKGTANSNSSSDTSRNNNFNNQQQQGDLYNPYPFLANGNVLTCKQQLEVVKNCNWSSWSKDKLDADDFTYDAKDAIFRQYKLYKHEKFRNFLCTLDNGQRFEELYRRILKNPNIPVQADSGDFFIRDFALNQMNLYHQKKQKIKLKKEILPKVIEGYQKQFDKFKDENQESQDPQEHEFEEPDLLQEFKDNQNLYSNPLIKEILNSRIKITQNSGNDVVQESYAISDDTKKYLAELGLSESILENCYGNALSQQLHLESLNIIEQSAELHKLNYQEIKNLTEFATVQGYTACALNKQGCTKEGFAWADAGHCVISFTKGIYKAAGEDLSNKKETIKKLWQNPVGTLANLANDAAVSIWKAIKMAGKLYAYAPDHDECSLDLNKIDEEQKNFDEAFKPQLEQIEKVVATISSASAQEICEAAGHIAFNLISSKYEIPACAKILKIFKLKDKLKKLGKVGEQTVEITKLAKKHGNAKVKEAIATIKKYPHLLQDCPQIAKAIEQTTEYIKNYDYYFTVLAESIKRRARDSKYNRYFKDLCIPPGFVPALVGDVPIMLDNTNYACEIVDVLGNRLKIDKTTKMLTHLKTSGLCNKTVGWMSSSKNKAKQVLKELKAGTLHMQHFLNIEKDIVHLEQKFKNLKLTICTTNNIILNNLDFSHLFNVDIKTCMRKGIKRLSGFHHDFKSYVENNKLVQFANKKMHQHGFYQAYTMFDGKISKNPKSFFPSHWTREKVIGKIIEACNNYKGIPAAELGNNGYWKIKSFINEGIEIQIIIDQTCQLVTAYPLL